MLGIPAPAPASAPLPPVAPAAAPAPGQAAAGGSDASELEPEWTVALTDDQHEEMRTGEVVELYARGTIDHETFIWADGMEDWKQPWEIPLISVALAARGLSMPAEGEEYSDMAMQEPEHDDATVVASFRFGPPSSRGKMSSGVWHEPGRAEVEEVGFDDVTMSVDSHRARQMLQQATREAGPNADDIQYGAPPSEMPPRGEMRSVEEDVDDLIAGLDEPTVAAPSAFQAESRPLSDWPTSVDTQAVQPPDSSFDQDEQATTIEQRPTGARNVDSVLFSLDNLLQSPPSSSHPVAPQAERDLFADLPSGIPAAHADQPLDAAFGGPQSSRQGPAYGAPVSAAVPSERKRGSGCIWVLLIAVVLLGAAGAGAWYFQQPAMLWKDGRLNLPVSW